MAAMRPPLSATIERMRRSIAIVSDAIGVEHLDRRGVDGP
jgi:hypothetical protein